MSTPRSTQFRCVLAAVALALTAGACASDIVKSYDDPQAKANFVDSCTQTRSVSDGKVTITQLAPKSTCECVFHDIWKVYSLSWDDLTAYEAKVASAKAGSPPAMPAKLTKAIDNCEKKSGPTVSSKSATTTTSG